MANNLGSISIIIMIACFTKFTNSAKIIYSVNATDFMKGDAAELTCAFPANPAYSILVWYNKALPNRLLCKTPTTCNTDPRFLLTRNGYNITLIIKHVNVSQTSWECMDLGSTISEILSFNVIVNPPLNITITNSQTGLFFWEIETSCSNPLPKITCKDDHSATILMNNLTTSKCNTSLLSSMKGVIKYSATTSIMCYVNRSSESAVAYGLQKFELTVENLASCIYKIETSCTPRTYDFNCVNKGNPMNFKVENHPCKTKYLKTYHIELKSLAYGSTFNCNITDGRETYFIQKKVSCHLPFYISGGIFISVGLLLAGIAVTIYLFKFGTMKNSNTWKFILWCVGIICVDTGVLLFLWTISWEFLTATFLPFFLLLTLKNIMILIIGLYINKNGGFFFMHSSKVFADNPGTSDTRSQQLGRI